jgi:chromosome segregation ATPase
LENSLSSAQNKIESFTKETAILRLDIEKLNIVNRQLQSERHDFESKLLWTKETLNKTEVRERKSLEDYQIIENQLRTIGEQKVMLLFMLEFSNGINGVT